MIFSGARPGDIVVLAKTNDQLSRLMAFMMVQITRAAPSDTTTRNASPMTIHPDAPGPMTTDKDHGVTKAVSNINSALYDLRKPPGEHWRAWTTGEPDDGLSAPFWHASACEKPWSSC